MKCRNNTSPLGTSHFDLSATLLGLYPFNTPGTLETGSIASFQPPGTLRTGGNRSIQPTGTCWTGGTQSFQPPMYAGDWVLQKDWYWRVID